MLDQKKMDRFKECGGSVALELRGEIIDALKCQINETVQAVMLYHFIVRIVIR